MTQISPPHQTFVIPSRAQMGAQVITYILLITKHFVFQARHIGCPTMIQIVPITKHFVIQSGSEWVHKRVNFLPSLNSQKKSSIGRMQNSQTHFFQTKQSTIEYTLNTNWVINQTLTSPWLFSYQPLSDDGHMYVLFFPS